MLNTKGLVALTEHQQVGWRLIKVENQDKKITKDIHSQFWPLKNMAWILKYEI